MSGNNVVGVVLTSPKQMEREDLNEAVNCLCSQSEECVKSTYLAVERSPLSQTSLEINQRKSGGGIGPLKFGKENNLSIRVVVRSEAPFFQVEKKKSKKSRQTVGASQVGVSTKQKSKADIGTQNTTPGRKTTKWMRDQECRCNIADGS